MIEQLNKIRFLNEELEKQVLNAKFFVNKYLRLDYFENNVKEGCIQFGTPESWVDPYELLYYKREFYGPLFEFAVPEIRCLCLTQNNNKNEDAMWSIYRYASDEPVIKVTYNFYELLKQFNDYCIKEKCTLYIGTIDYSYLQTQIETLLDKNINEELYNKFFPRPFNLINYLNLLLLKRKQFIYENEIRLFLIKDHQIFGEEPEKVFLNYEEPNLISTIRINPVPPKRNRENSDDLYRKENTKHANSVKARISKLLNIEHRKLQQCRLYESVQVRKITQEVLNELLQKYGHKCSMCGSTDNLCIDRIFPRRYGGKDYINNFAILCRRCNAIKAAKLPL